MWNGLCGLPWKRLPKYGKKKKNKVNQAEAELSWYGKGIKKQDGHIWYGVGGGKLTGCGINHQAIQLKSHCCLEED